MRYVIYGAGGIGAGIGAELFQSGLEVVLIARGEHLERLQSDGLTVRTPAAELALPIPAVSGPAAAELRGDDVVFFTMKSQDTEPALDELRAAARSDVAVVMAQNGVANERRALRRFDNVYGMLVNMPAMFLEPGRVILHGWPKCGVLHAGRYPAGVDDTIAEICSDLRSARFESQPQEAIMRLKHGKLLMNLGNAVQALCGIETDLREITRALRIEAMKCLEAAGIEFVTAGKLFEMSREFYHLGEIEGEPRQGGSSWQGMMRGRRSIETDYLNGEIVLLGKLHGVPTPLNEAVQRLANQAAVKATPPGSISVDEVWSAGRSG